MFDKKLLINEIFLSIQGESINTCDREYQEHLGVGTPTIFIRTQNCCCKCKYCDTKYASDAKSHEGTNMTIRQILDKCNELSDGVYNRICLTGGEPGIQKNITQLIHVLHVNGYIIGVETSGAVDIRKFQGMEDPKYPAGQCHYSADSIVMDWKGPSAGVKSMFKMLTDNWKYLRRCDQVKFLVKDKRDWDFLIRTLEATKILDKKDRPIILVSPVFDNDGKHNAKCVVKWLLKSKLPLILNLQIHKLIWDVSERGV